MNINEKFDYNDLFETITSIKTKEECEQFFTDLCTLRELDSMAQRINAARLLISGETYESIIKKTDISSATLSRVSRSVKYGNGYKTVLNKNAKKQ